MKASAVAHPNIALAKYWGKREGEGNVPAVPSLSVTLAGMTTTTTVELDPKLVADELHIGGRLVSGAAREKGVKVLELLRRETQGPAPFARVLSENDFPTASGLASSASGMAALAVAGAGAYGLSLGATELSSIAREGSASAARSLFGGYVELVPGSAAVQVAEPSHLELRVLVCVVSEAPKETSSTDGMRQTQARSPYYAAWTSFAPKVFEELKAAVLSADFSRVGELAESSALAMHASALAAGVLYFRDATYAVYRTVQRLRAEGLSAYATMDAGPHVKVLTTPNDVAKVSRALEGVPGVLRLIEASPGRGASRVT